MSAIAKRQFFDRRTFDPSSDERHAAILANLRAFGRRRLSAAMGRKRFTREHKSTAFRWAEKTGEMKGAGQALVDLGCGESADCYIAMAQGFTAYGFDLIAPRDDGSMAAFANWIQADVVEAIPLPESSVDIALCSAMVDLIEPNARGLFYSEVHRVLKPGGLFSCFIQWLAPGYGFDAAEEHQRAIAAGFTLLSRGVSGFVARKEITNE